MAAAVLKNVGSLLSKFRPVVFAHLQAKSSSSVAGKIEEGGVVPDVIDKAPSNKLDVIYGGKEVQLGNVLTPTDVKTQPEVNWKFNEKTLYTLCMTDPDAPSRTTPTYREWLHWLVGNIPGNKIELGTPLADYIGAGPPKDTGLHRYVFLVYEQSEKKTFDEKHLPNNSADGRGGFQIRKFAKKYNLGDPVAVNFFQAQYDDYVPTLYKQLGA